VCALKPGGHIGPPLHKILHIVERNFWDTILAYLLSPKWYLGAKIAVKFSLAVKGVPQPGLPRVGTSEIIGETPKQHFLYPRH
jgi:hypothetical protein